MTTSVIIPSFNGQKHLARNLPAVMALGADEIIVVDDASADGTTQYPGVKFIRHPRNLRFPITVNDGFTAASGDIVFLLNQDVKPDKSLITNTLPHFADPKVFAVTFNEEGRSWADGKWVKGFLEFKNGKRDNRIHQSLWASGGSAAFRKTIWDRLGGFDPIFTPGYFEDLDLGLRAHAAGYKIIWDPKCRVDHLVSGTFPKTFSPKKLQYIKERNYLIAVWKNIDPVLWPKHIAGLIKRIITGPGYIVPVLWALWKKLAS